MRTRSVAPRRRLSIPEIPRITAGLVLAAGALGQVIGAGGISEEVAPEFLIVVISSIGLLVSGLVARSSRGARVRQRSADLSGSREFRREFIRARRRESPMTVVRLPAPIGAPQPDRDARERLRMVRRSLRRIDLSWVSHGDVYLALPDTDSTTARAVLDRLRHRAPAAFSGEQPLVAAFPEDGLTAAALVAILTGRLARGSEPAPDAAPLRDTVRHAAQPAVPRSASTGEVELTSRSVTAPQPPGSRGPA